MAAATDPSPAEAPTEDATPAGPGSSRLFVRGLPKYVDDTRLREHFSEKGDVTDVKVMRTRDGASRCFGFVGFRDAEAAARALKYFDRTFMDTARLEVAFAERYGAQPTDGAARPWSKHTEGTSAWHRAQEAKEVRERGKAGGPGGKGGKGGEGSGAGALAEPKPMTAREAIKAEKAAKRERRERRLAAAGLGADAAAAAADPKLAEFMELMKPRSARPVWEGGDVAGATAAASAAAAEAASRDVADVGAGPAWANGGEGDAGEMAAPPQSESDDEYEDLTVGAKGARAGGAGPHPSDGADVGEQDVELIGVDPLVADVAISDLDYLKSRVATVFSDDEDDSGGNDGDDSDEEGGEEEVEEEEAREGEGRGEEGEGGEGGDGASRADGNERGAAAAGDDPAGPGGPAASRRAGDGGGPGPSAEEKILAGGRLFLRNLSYGATEDELRKLLERFGEVEELRLPLDRATRRIKGFAHATFADPRRALEAFRALDMTSFQGRLLHVLPGEPRPEPPTPEGGGDASAPAPAMGKGNYKAETAAARRAAAGTGSEAAAWNSLYVRPDTAAEAVAAHYGVSKADLVGRDAADAAVRMALGEAAVLAATKVALREAGVDASLLERASGVAPDGAVTDESKAASRALRRSRDTIVVKNLPWAASEAELAELFGARGDVDRLVFPPSKALAVVRFSTQAEAKRAFSALAYRKLHDAPLYLEWAPEGLLSDEVAAQARREREEREVAAAKVGAGPARDVASGPRDGPAPARQQQQQQLQEAGVEGEEQRPAQQLERQSAAAHVAAARGAEDAPASAAPAAGATLYVKNLAWGTGDASLRAAFEAAAAGVPGAAVRSARVAMRPDPKAKGKKAANAPLVSSGYGFVELSSEAAASAVREAMDGAVLDGHKLVVAVAAGGGRAAGAAGPGSAPSSGPSAERPPKLVVRNVAFQATRTDIAGLFGAFGDVKSARLPRKFDGSHRGYCFVEFGSAQEAADALKGAQGTHLYGRRLVVEWAEADGGVEEVRAKTKAKFEGDASQGRKRART